MFPNFKNLADREQKRLALLEKAQRRKRQATEKREMYEGTQWATDGDKSTTLGGSKTTDTNIHMTATEIEDAIKNADSTKEKILYSNGSKKKASGSNEGSIPEVIDIPSNGVASSANSSSTSSTPISSPESSSISSPAISSISSVSSTPKSSPVTSTRSSVSDVPDFDLFDVYDEDYGKDNAQNQVQEDEESDTVSLQADSRKYVKNMFSKYKELQTLKMSPYDSNGRPLNHLYLNKNAAVYKRQGDGKQKSQSKKVDWARTADEVYNYLRNSEELKRMYPRVSNEELNKDYLNEGRKAFKAGPADKISAFDKYNLQSQTGQKRKSAEAIEEAVRKILKNSSLNDKESDTQLDNLASKSKLRFLMQYVHTIAKRPDIQLEPVLKLGSRLSGEHRDKNIVILHNREIVVVGRDSQNRRQAVEKRVDWNQTLNNYINLTKVAGVDYGNLLAEEKKMSIKNKTKFEDDGIYNGTKIGIEKDTRLEMTGNDDVESTFELDKADTHLTDSDMDAKKLLHIYYEKLIVRDLTIPLKLHPIWETGVDSDNPIKKKLYMNKTYFINNGFIPSLTSTGKPIYGKVLTDFNSKTQWAPTLDALMEGLEELYNKGEKKEQLLVFNKVFHANSQSVLNATPRSINPEPSENESPNTLTPLEEAASKVKFGQRKVAEAKELLMEAENLYKIKGTKKSKAAVKAAKANLKAQKAALTLYIGGYKALKKSEIEGQGVKLKGRGLKGAGQYRNMERRGKYYNLNDIQGTGLASAYIYQPIGSKYIRIPDLDKGELNIVYQSRKKLGPKRKIGEGVQQMIKDLVYGGQINQDGYDKLSTDDKRLFKEILHATHIQHCFRDELTDPMESLKAEYDKLKGEIELGNDNPSIIKQMKLVVVDMYSNKLISDNEFKHMITRLI